MAERRGAKIHVDATPDRHSGLDGDETTRSYCGKPVWADVAMPVAILETWAEHDLTPSPLCMSCVTKTGVEFKKKETATA